MLIKNSDYLHEMGIQCWKLAHPERLQGYQQADILLPNDCKILLVSPQALTDETTLFLSRVLKSMGLNLEQSQFIEPQNFPLIKTHSLQWVWFAGCGVQQTSITQILSSDLLSNIDGNNEQRRQLWQQICAYE